MAETITDTLESLYWRGYHAGLSDSDVYNDTDPVIKQAAALRQESVVDLCLTELLPLAEEQFTPSEEV